MEAARIIVLSPDELSSIIDNAIEKFVNRQGEIKQSKKLAYGISGIASIFGCSISTANRIKKSGIINEAVTQSNRTIVVDVNLALELYKKYSNNNISNNENYFIKRNPHD